MLFPCLSDNGGGGPRPPSTVQRIFVVLMLGLCIALMYGMRADLSVGIGVMQTAWPGGSTGLVLSAFFCGYFVGNIPGSKMAQRYGAREVLAVGVVVACVANAAIPLFTSSPWVVVLLRMLCGLSQACIFPCTYSLLFAWATPDTRSRAVTSSMSLGAAVGTASGFTLSEAMRSAYGLTGCFDVWSGMGLVWAIVWVALVPGHVPSASTDSPRNDALPWRALALQPTLVALYCTHIAANFINYGLLTQV